MIKGTEVKMLKNVESIIFDGVAYESESDINLMLASIADDEIYEKKSNYNYEYYELLNGANRVIINIKFEGEESIDD